MRSLLDIATIVTKNRASLLLASITTCSLALPLSEAKGSRSGPVHVHGYFTKTGKYVAPYTRSAPDGNFYNNWSTVGNYNPYTGAAGTHASPPWLHAGHPGGSNSNHSLPAYSPYSTASPGNSSAYTYSPNNQSNYPAPSYAGAYSGTYPSTPSYDPASQNSMSSLQPQTTQEFVLLSEQYSRAGDFKNAVFALGKAVALSPEEEDLRKRLAIAYYQLGRTSKTQESFPFFHRSLAIYPTPEGAEFLSQAINASHRDPQSSKQRLKCADIAHRLGDNIGEIVEYKEAVRLNPEDGEGYLLLARSYVHSGFNRAAIREFDAAAQHGISPDRFKKERDAAERTIASPPFLPAYYFVADR